MNLSSECTAARALTAARAAVLKSARTQGVRGQTRTEPCVTQVGGVAGATVSRDSMYTGNQERMQ